MWVVDRSEPALAAAADMTDTLTSLGETAAAEAVRRSHRDFYLSLTEQAASARRGADRRAWSELVARSFENIAAAFEWSLERNEVDEALGLVGALVGFAEPTALGARVRGMLERGLDRGGGAAARARALIALGVLRSAPTLKFTPEQLRATLDEAVASARASGDRRLQAAALAVRGGAQTDFRWYPRDPEVLNQAMAAAREVDDEAIAADIVLARASAAVASGDPDEVTRQFDAALSRLRAIGDASAVAWALYEVAVYVLQPHGRPTAARQRLEEMWDVGKQIDDALVLACAGHSLSAYFEDSGRYDEGQARFEQAIASARRSDAADLHHWMLCELGNFHEQFGQLDAATRAYEEALSLSPAWDNGSAHSGLAAIAARLGDDESASARADEAVRVARAKAYWSPADALLPAATVAMHQGRFDDAERFLEEALDYRDQHLRWWLNYHHYVRAQLHELRGEYQAAVAVFNEVIAGAKGSWFAVDALRRCGAVETQRGNLSRAAGSLAAALDGAMQRESNRLVVITAYDVGRLAGRHGSERVAQRLVSSAERLRREFGWSVPLLLIRHHEATIREFPPGADSVGSVDEAIDLAREALAMVGRP